jgi:DeoR family fructose operon transcriptional repressor
MSGLVNERRQKLMELVSNKRFMSVDALAEALQAHPNTVRRDIEFLGEQGLVRRTYGGASRAESGGLPALEERAFVQLREKEDIARATAAQIADGQAVLLDGGTTTLAVARQLVGRPLQIVTNSLPIANLFASSRETELVFLGGYIYPKTGVALGPSTLKMLADVHVSLAIMSVGGITAKGLFNSNLLLVETERQMMRCADKVTVVADHTKIGRQALAFLCQLAEIDTLIVDAGLNAEQRGWLEKADVSLVVAGETTGQASPQ